MHTDGLHAITLVDCVAGFYASSSIDGCKGGLRLQVLPSTAFFRLHSLSAGFDVDVFDAVGASFFDEVLQALPASDATLRPSTKMAAWVADPIQRWLADCLRFKCSDQTHWMFCTSSAGFRQAARLWVIEGRPGAVIIL